MTDIFAVQERLAGLANFRLDGDTLRRDDYAPDSGGADTAPGSAWGEECDALLAEVQALLPPGWAAEWVDDDLVVARS